MDEFAYIFLGILFGAIFIQQRKLNQLQSRVQQLELGKDLPTSSAVEATDPV